MGEGNAGAQQQDGCMTSPISIDKRGQDTCNEEKRNQHDCLQTIDSKNARPHAMECFRTVPGKKGR